MRIEPPRPCAPLYWSPSGPRRSLEQMLFTLLLNLWQPKNFYRTHNSTPFVRLFVAPHQGKDGNKPGDYAHRHGGLLPVTSVVITVLELPVQVRVQLLPPPDTQAPEKSLLFGHAPGSAIG